jgi:hypothetical protein
VKALRDLGCLLVVLLGLLWLAAPSAKTTAQAAVDTVNPAAWVVPPPAKASLEQMPVVQITSRVLVVAYYPWRHGVTSRTCAFAQALHQPTNWQACVLLGNIREQQRALLFPFHEFG